MTKYCKYSKTKQTNTGKHYTAYYIINKKYIFVQFSVERVFPTYSITSGNADEIIVSLDEKNKTDFNNAIELFSDLQNQYKSFYEKKTVENLVIQFNDIYSKPKLIMFIQSDAIIYTPATDDVKAVSGYVVDQWFDENEIAYHQKYNFVETALKDLIFTNYIDVLNEI